LSSTLLSIRLKFLDINVASEVCAESFPYRPAQFSTRNGFIWLCSGAFAFGLE
jgi:hypothetical protein